MRHEEAGTWLKRPALGGIQLPDGLRPAAFFFFVTYVVEGREVVAPEEEEEPEVINLMDALRKSLAKGESKTSRSRGGRKKARRRA